MLNLYATLEDIEDLCPTLLTNPNQTTFEVHQDFLPLHSFFPTNAGHMPNPRGIFC